MEDPRKYPPTDINALLGSFDLQNFIFQILCAILVLVLVALFVTMGERHKAKGGRHPD
jgi:hypothetical protein